MAKIRITGILLLFVSFMTVSCNKEGSYDPITLSYDAYGPIFDNQTKLISIPLLSESLPMLINGGDGHFSITNNSESIIAYILDGRTLTVQAISPGTGSITIKDNSRNSYTLEVAVFSNEIPKVKVSSYAIVRGVNMDFSRRTALEHKIVADAPTGIWQFISNGIITEGIPFKARLYLTDAMDSEYKEYTAVLQNKNPQGQIVSPIVVLAWFIMKSDTEEFELYFCQPLQLDNGTLIRGYTIIRNVTSKYISEYPEMTQAFEVQSYDY